MNKTRMIGAAGAVSLGLSLVALGACQLDEPQERDAPLMTYDEVAAAGQPVLEFIDPAGTLWTYRGQVERATGPVEYTAADLAEDGDGGEAAPTTLVFVNGREYVTTDDLDVYRGEEFPGTVQDGAPRQPAPQHVINDGDNRVQVSAPWNQFAPFSRVVKLVTTDNFNCSGAMFGPRHVLTAGHCLHTGKRSGRHHGAVTATPAMTCASGATCMPYGSATELARIVSSGWRGGIRYRWAQDWAIVILSSPLGDDTGWFGFGTTPKSELKDLRVTTYGYPLSKPFGTMWGMSCRVGVVFPRKFRYKCDVTVGQSGSGIWAGNKLRGIVSNETLFANRAVRINDDVDRAMRRARANFP